MLYISNAFSLGMLPEWKLSNEGALTGLTVEAVTDSSVIDDAIRRHGGFVSAVGHADTAAVFSSILNLDVQMNRISVQLGEDDELLVGQLVGGRLPEGATTLPEGFSIRWVLVSID